MIKSTKDLRDVIEKVAGTRNMDDFIRIIVFALDEVLSMNDFNLLIERLKEDIEEDVGE